MIISILAVVLRERSFPSSLTFYAPVGTLSMSAIVFNKLFCKSLNVISYPFSAEQVEKKARLFKT